ncbi:ABC transporter substrate-binding protein [Methanospirillum lacunae]|uniref:ABC transporter substrate-binding protein n=1 Tax=Methanospirillum lacunae TaxID=668570 RepID=A0A2V2MSX4_9EURY|nr:ABC transporter substrate-binding protein [Methanospirillum lacunae]PWR71304.1 ABC transporter substrate-binding protein [Methanospirillum lacunae]
MRYFNFNQSCKSLIAVLLILGLLSIPSAFAASTSSGQTGTQIVTDLAGRDVTIPNPITNISCLHPIPTYMAWRLAPEKLASIDMVSKSRTYLMSKEGQKLFGSLPVTGVYFKGLNNEQVISLKPDVIVSMTKDPNVDKEQDTFNIPVVTVKKDTIEDYEPSFRFMGKVVGNEKEGNELADYWKDTINRVKDASSKIPDDKKLRVFYTGATSKTVPGSATIMSSIVRDAGGIPYADAVTLSGDKTNEGIEVSVEDIIKWNPDVIIAQNTNVTNDIMNDPVWKDTTAMKNDRVYCVPKYEFPDGITSIIGLMWVTETLYPDQMPFDIPKETRNFFQKFYKVSDLTDDQIAMKNS